MAEADADIAGLAGAVVRFPERPARLHQLSLTEPDFREICEEYALAQQSLARLEARPDAVGRPEFGDYRIPIAQLESEIHRMLQETAQKG